MGHTLDQFLDKARSDLAYTDDLTGLLNARLLSTVFQSRWAELLAAHETLTLIIIDLDGFKDVNDRYGHLTGNEVLKTTARVLRQHFRSNDIVVRYGGDEFVIVLPGAGRDEADDLAERARDALAESSFTSIESGEPVDATVSFSIGAASYPEDGSQGEELLQRADQLLLADKDSRRSSTGATSHRPMWAAVTVLGTLAVLAVLTTLVVVTRTGPSPADTADPLFRSTPTSSVPESLAPSREEELLAQIADLEAQLTGLTEEMDRQSADHQREYKSEIEDLVTRIRELQVEAREEQSRPEAVEPTPLPATEIAVVRPEPVRPTATATPQPIVDQRPTAVVAAEQPTPAVRPPILTWAAEPRYPEMAKRFSMEASVELRVTVSVNGHIIHAEPTGDNAGYGFDQAAREAAFKARYEPASVDGVPVEMETTLTIHFRLDRSSVE